MNRIENSLTATLPQRGGKRGMKLLAGGVAVVALCLGLSGQARANEEVYRKTALGTVDIERPDGGYGSGFLIDAAKGYVVTARHVVAKNGGTLQTVDVVFARTDKDGEIITDADHYAKNFAKLRARATVVHASILHDLAILRLEKVPAGAVALKLAARPARPGQEIHVVGNSTKKHGGMFRYCSGKVSNVFRWSPPLPNPILSHVVAHYAPTNRGDSGGPVVNNKGEVVAFVSQGTMGASSSPRSPRDWDYQQQVVDHSICVREIHAALKELSSAK
jgi:S1-C subfamily serine protease